MTQNSNKEKIVQDYSRREFFKASALAVGAAGALAACSKMPAQKESMSKGMHLNMAGYDFDRTRGLIDGRAPIVGCDIQFDQMGIGDINTNVISGPQTLDRRAF